MSTIEINHNGPIQWTEYASYTVSLPPSPTPNAQPPKQPQEFQPTEKEDWYVVADGIVFTRR